MSKFVNWDQNYKAPMKRGDSFREKYGAAVQRELKADDTSRDWKFLEETVKKSLLDHMVNRKKILVTRPFQIVTEKLNKSESGAGYSETFITIEPGTELVYVTKDKTFGQWIFKSTSGEEYEIYDKPQIILGNGPQARLIANPGFWGLLTCTHIYDYVLAADEQKEDE